tara:strand:- start:3751 stop:4278 length:528 start_codon:yes stop_codon:yes gene_type:complete
MKIFSTALFILLFSFFEKGYSQSVSGPPIVQSRNIMNTVYVEYRGNAFFGSLNYDLIFDSDYGLRIGVSPGLLLIDNENSDTESDNKYDLTGLVSAFKLIGSNSHKVEAGLGAIFGESKTQRDDDKPAVPAVVLNVGYRFITQKEKGLNFRTMFTPSLSKNGLIPWFGASIGISF